MNYPVVIHKDAGSDYGVTVPDLPGCFSAGATMDEALAMAQEAIELHLEGLIEDGLTIPPPTSIEAHKSNPQYAGGTWAVVAVDESNLRICAKRVNITLPERVLDAVDRCAKSHGQTRSGLLARAAVKYMANQPMPAKARPALAGKGKKSRKR
jgi:predicted RNase H-like HicB family nuclease